MKVNKKFHAILTLTAILIFTLAGVVLADDGESRNEEKLSFAIETANVEISGPLGGETATYTVTAGLTPIFDDGGIRRAQIFSTAYAIKPDAGEKRPVAFIFNGGGRSRPGILTTRPF